MVTGSPLRCGRPGVEFRESLKTTSKPTQTYTLRRSEVGVFIKEKKKQPETGK